MQTRTIKLLPCLASALLALLLGLPSTISNSNIAAPTQNSCATTPEIELVKSIYRQIKLKYDGQQSHINVRIKNSIVTLEGWVTTKAVRKDIERFAKRTKCVKKVVNQLTIGIGAGCTRGQKKCGDICIPADQECNIGLPEN